MNEHKCPKCGNELLNAIINGQSAIICENCLLKQGQALNIEMKKCEICDHWYHSQQTICECRKLGNQDGQ
jgi:hypothetical protein